jgi:citrate lyase synthetase
MLKTGRIFPSGMIIPIEEKNFAEIAKIVPETTLGYLRGQCL